MPSNRLAEAMGSLLNPLASDQRTICERAWVAPVRAPVRQLPCDVGLFGDERLQMDLVEMFQDPVDDD